MLNVSEVEQLEQFCLVGRAVTLADSRQNAQNRRFRFRFHNGEESGMLKTCVLSLNLYLRSRPRFCIRGRVDQQSRLVVQCANTQAESWVVRFIYSHPYAVRIVAVAAELSAGVGDFRIETAARLNG